MKERGREAREKSTEDSKEQGDNREGWRHKTEKIEAILQHRLLMAIPSSIAGNEEDRWRSAYVVEEIGYNRHFKFSF